MLFKFFSYTPLQTSTLRLFTKIFFQGREPVLVYIWYAGYKPHEGPGYERRVSRISSKHLNGTGRQSRCGPRNGHLEHRRTYGQATLNLTNVRISDQGLYQCILYFFDRSPDFPTNGSFVHLEVRCEYKNFFLSSRFYDSFCFLIFNIAGQNYLSKI